ncbi:hypothetical protein ACFXJ5_34800 [Streptomyces sp. NPDC059373]
MEAEREALRITAETIHAMAAGLEFEQSPAPALPGGAACRQFMGVFGYEQRPLRGRDLCQAFGLPVLPERVEGTRAKLERRVSLGFLDETGPGLFARPRAQAQIAPAGQGS